MFGTTLVEVPLENRDSASYTKKLCTAVSIEAPNLFRIHGVPCIDRGPDKSRPPAVYEHWDGSGDSNRNRENGQEMQGVVLKRTANFGRPSSVSADTPNFFKVPGVAINSSSAITGVDAVCSPPPRHQPFNLPKTYMHDRKTKAVIGPKTIPGRWRETDRQVGQWGHATQEFHQALLKMRQEGGAQAPPKPSETSARPSYHSGGNRELRSTSPGLSRDEAVNTAVARPPTSSRQHTTQRNNPKGGAGESPGKPAREKRTTDEDIPASEKELQSGNLPMTAVQVFMSRLEGERGPQNRRESIAAFTDILRGCSTNNSSELRDNTVVGTSRHGRSLRVADEKKVNSAELRRVLARRDNAQRVVSGIMGTAEGSYMLSREADTAKICLGRVKGK